MGTRMIKAAILSAWLAATLLMWFAATKSFAAVDRVLRNANPQFVEAAKGMAEGQTRVVLRHLASEINRAYFRGYGLAQVVLGAVLLLLLWRETPRDSIGLGVVCTIWGWS
jgi:ABC-type dipeptide/oligopeptide/nickel transport system permease subunit